jgi:hypothetical protein
LPTNGTPTGDTTGCNAQESNPVVITLQSNNAGVTFPSGDSASITLCDEANGKTVSYAVSSTASGTATISVKSVTGGKVPKPDEQRLFDKSDTLVINISAPADTAAPQWSCTPTAADGNWHGDEQSFSCTASDSSGLKAGSPASFTLTTSVGSGNEDGSASTDSQQLCDIHNNCTTAGPITGNKVDRKAPAVNCAAADNDWHSTDQSSACTASDGGSGLANPADASFNLSTNVPAGTETDNASTGSRSVPDYVGNSTTAGPVSGWKIDKKGPTNITFSGIAAQQYVIGSVPAASGISCDATDGGSGLAGCQVTGGYGTSIGSHTLTATATDNVGNESTSQLTYSVVYAWNGFFRPVDNLPMLNTVKAGSAVPVKFSLGGYYGLDVITKAASIVQACNAAAGTDAIEETVTAGNSSLSYDAATDTYNYVWKTDKTWAGKCRQLQITLNDGTTHAANFQMQK